MTLKDLGRLLQPFQHRGLKFKNRSAMSSMTRCRAEPDGCPTDLVKEYYIQRSIDAGFIGTEAMGIFHKCNPWLNSCNVITPKAVQKWTEIIDGVHKNNAVIFAQLVHGGRSVHPDYSDGETPMGPSAIAIKGDSFTPKGKKPHVVPREMTKKDIQDVKDAYKVSIGNAIKAGFDGIEFHGANGYLIDEFLRSGSNHRTDEYGGSIENRSRLLLELVDDALKTVPAEKIGIKISLASRYQDMYDDNPEALGQYVLGELSKRKILYVNMTSPEPTLDGVKQMPNPTAFGRKHFKGLIIGDGNVSLEERLRRLNSGEADLISFGQMFWANPDLVQRLKNGWELNTPEFQYAYQGGQKSYTDIPRYNTSQKL